MYADDINLLHSGKSLCHIINDVNSDLQCLFNWFSTNKLRVNHNKSNYIIFHSPQHKIPSLLPPVLFDKNCLQHVNSCKFLGIILDEFLSWKAHINYVCKKNNYWYPLLNQS